MGTTVIEEMAHWAHSLKWEDLPDRVKLKARLQLLSVIAAIHASRGHEIGELIHSSLMDWASPGPCTLIPEGEKVDLLSAVYGNAALSLALDYDDYLLFGHTGHSAVCASLAVAEREDRSLRDALTAQVIANEIAGRLGAGVVFGPHNGQGWSHIHLAGSAAAAAKLLGLSEERMAHAIAISLYQPTYLLWPGFMGPDAKAVTAATPSMIGVQAALQAGRGMTGPLEVIEHPQGYLAQLSYLPTGFFLTGLGRAWVTDTLAYKVYPGCAYIDTAVDAILKLRGRFKEETGDELDPAQIREVLVEATILTVEMDHLSRTGESFDLANPVIINFSIPASAAIALLKGRLTTADLARKALEQERTAILELSEKIRLEHDWSLTLRFLEAQSRVLGFDRIMREIKLRDLLRARSRIQGHYRSSMGFGFADLKALWTQAPEARTLLWRWIKQKIKSVTAGGRRKASTGFDLGDCPLQEFTMPFAARVSVTMKDGKIFTELQEVPRGGPGHPLDSIKEAVLEKYARETEKDLGRKKLEVILNSADDLEQKLSLKKLLANCCR